MFDLNPSLFEQFTKLAAQLRAIRTEAEIDMSSSGLTPDVTARIDNPTEDDFKTVTLSQLSAYLFPLGYQLKYKPSGTSKLSNEVPRVTIMVEPILPNVTDMAPANQ